MECDACKLLNKKDGIILEQKYTVAVLDPNQFYPGRTWVIHKKHIENENELSESEQIEFFKEVMKISKALYSTFQCPRVNYLMLMNSDRHVHIHLVPRLKEELEQNPFPPNLGELRVAGESEYRETLRKVKENIQ